MSMRFPVAMRTSRVTVIKTAIDSGGGPGVRRVYSSPRPGPDEDVTGTLLGELTFSYPCGIVTSGVLTFDTITQDGMANATGTAAWYRDFSSSGTPAGDGSVTTTGGGGDMTLNTVSIVEGGPISVTGTKTISEGGA